MGVTRTRADAAIVQGGKHLKSGLPKDFPLMAIPRRRISLLVSVPVLSENTYAARPRSSMMLLLRALAHCRVTGSRISGSRKMKYACVRSKRALERLQTTGPHLDAKQQPV